MVCRFVCTCLPKKLLFISGGAVGRLGRVGRVGIRMKNCRHLRCSYFVRGNLFFPLRIPQLNVNPCFWERQTRTSVCLTLRSKWVRDQACTVEIQVWSPCNSVACQLMPLSATTQLHVNSCLWVRQKRSAQLRLRDPHSALMSQLHCLLVLVHFWVHWSTQCTFEFTASPCALLSLLIHTVHGWVHCTLVLTDSWFHCMLVLVHFWVHCKLVLVHCLCLGLARTIYKHCMWPYFGWFSCQKYHIYTVYIWFWPTLRICVISLPIIPHVNRIYLYIYDIWFWPTLLLSSHSC